MKQLMSTLFFFCCAFQPLYSQSEYNEQKLYQVMETDTMPIYKGGYMALLSYINNTLIYPQIYNEASIQGRVICQLIIEKDGTISSVKVIRGIDKYLDEEVVRVVKSMPKWLPGKRRGDAVRVEYYLPVICRIR
jgi:protein TonB